MMGVRKIAADHHLRQARGRFLTRVADTRDPAAAKHGCASAKGPDFIELVADMENAAAFARLIEDYRNR
jgi:hypothetical protein